jgi:hypothetical protein
VGLRFWIKPSRRSETTRGMCRSGQYEKLEGSERLGGACILLRLIVVLALMLTTVVSSLVLMMGASSLNSGADASRSGLSGPLATLITVTSTDAQIISQLQSMNDIVIQTSAAVAAIQARASGLAGNASANLNQAYTALTTVSAAIASAPVVQPTQVADAASQILPPLAQISGQISTLSNVVWHVVVAAGGSNIVGKNVYWNSGSSLSVPVRRDPRNVVTHRIFQWPSSMNMQSYSASGTGNQYMRGGLRLPAFEPLVHLDPAGPTGYVDSVSTPGSDIVAVQSGSGPVISYCTEEMEKYPENHQWLIVPVGSFNSSLTAVPGVPASKRWTPGLPGADLYEHAIMQATVAVADVNPVDITILWAQGELDAQNLVPGPVYQASLDALVNGFRTRIPNASNASFIVLSMVPEWILSTSATVGSGGGTPSPSTVAYATAIDQVQADLPRRLTKTAYVRGRANCGEYSNAISTISYCQMFYSMSCQYENGAALSTVGAAAALSNVVSGGPAPAVTSLTVASITSSSACAYWNASIPASRVTGYTVEYASSGPFSVWSDGNSSTTSACVTGLSPTTVYNVRITPKNEAGPGVQTVSAPFTTLDPSQVTQTVIVSTRNTSVTIGWNAPSSTPVGSFNVAIKPSGGQASFVAVVSPGVASPSPGFYTASITGLTPETKYDVSVSIGTGIAVILSSVDTDINTGTAYPVMRFRANRGVVLDQNGYVAKWIDQTGNGYDMSPLGQGPRVGLYANTTVLRFRGSHCALSTPVGFPGTGAYTKMWVGAFDDFEHAGHLLSGLATPVNLYGGSPVLTHVLGRSLDTGKTNQLRVGYSQLAAAPSSAREISGGGLYFIVATNPGGASGSVTLYRNNVNDQSAGYTSSIDSGDTSVAVNSGYASTSIPRGGRVRVLEVAVWNSVLSAVDMSNEMVRISRAYGVSFAGF